jgi:hypothetical protein
LYVAITRSIDRLVLTRSESRNGAPTRPSPWLDAVAATISSEQPVAPPPHLPRRIVADPLADLKAWRLQVARGAGLSEVAICNDTVLRSLLEQPPATTVELAERLGITPLAAERLRPLPGSPQVQSSSTMTGA